MRAGRFFSLIAGIFFLTLGSMSLVPSLIESARAVPEVNTSLGTVGT